jgi:polyphosphate kinase
MEASSKRHNLESMPTITVPLLHRERAILAFNRRVLAQVSRADVPLLERLRYLCIVSSVLDEFFEIRAAPYLITNGGKTGVPDGSPQIYRELAADAHEIVQEQYRLYNDVLIPALNKRGIQVLHHDERNKKQREWVAEFFEQEVRPLLVPVGLDPSHPFPQVANKSLNFIVRLSGKDAFGRTNAIAIVKVPRVLPRVILLPGKVSGGKRVFVLLSSVIRAHLPDLFPGREVMGFSQFRVTRDSDLWVDEQEVVNLRQALRSGLTQRNFGNAVRLEVASNCPNELSTFLLKQFNLPVEALFRVHGPVNLVRLNALIDMIDVSAGGTANEKLRFDPYTPGWPRGLSANLSIFDQLRQGDVLLHHPFESFDPVVAFLREAVSDPKVLAIKQTIYRTGSDSVLMNLLLEAAKRGKEVTVVVELKARFDEEANINWAEKLEAVGAQVVYGVVGLKTHAKMLIVTRAESPVKAGKGGQDRGQNLGKRLARYVHLSTGNYNPRTAQLYTDFGFFTANAQIAQDVEHVFAHLASQTKLAPMAQLLVAPFHLHKKMIEWINATREAAKAGKPARIVTKMNALVDEALIEALIEAGQAGVKIDLIVRGACILPPGIKGATENIRVRSIVGRFLEHHRVFYFRAGAQEELYLSSADWMGRNMFRRIEIAWPVRDPALRQRVIDEALTAYLHDGIDAWQQQPNGEYTRLKSGKSSAQAALMRRYGA